MGGSWFLLLGVPLRSGVLKHSFPSADTLTGFFQILKRCNDNSIDDDYDCYDGNRLIIGSSQKLSWNFASVRIHKPVINVTVSGNLFWYPWKDASGKRRTVSTFNLLQPSGYDAPTGLSFNNCTLCPHCIYVFCVYLRTNSDVCHLQHKLIEFHSQDEKCLLRGTDWAFK